MSIVTKSSTGVEIVLTGIEVYENPAVLVEFTHPKMGKVSFKSSSYGERKGHHGIIGRIDRLDMPACITVPESAFQAAMQEARQISDREIAEIKSGMKTIQVRYHDGEYLSGYCPCNLRAAKLLTELGLAEEVNGWGTLVQSELVTALGEEFAYAAAAEFARPELEKKQAAADARSAVRQNKFDEARSTGQPVELSSWTEECCERDFDCDMDIVTQYAMPDGSTRCERIHTH